MNGMTSRTRATAVAKTPSTRPIAEAEKPRSWPRIGTRKPCTSQLDESSQLTSRRRLKPGACRRFQAFRRGARGASAGRTCLLASTFTFPSVIETETIAPTGSLENRSRSLGTSAATSTLPEAPSEVRRAFGKRTSPLATPPAVESVEKIEPPSDQ